jgi:hypothetical protein
MWTEARFPALKRCPARLFNTAEQLSGMNPVDNRITLLE